MQEVYVSPYGVEETTNVCGQLGSHTSKQRTTSDYIERFNKEAAHVKGTNEKMKAYMLRKGLLPDFEFVEYINLEPSTF